MWSKVMPRPLKIWQFHLNQRKWLTKELSHWLKCKYTVSMEREKEAPRRVFANLRWPVRDTWRKSDGTRHGQWKANEMPKLTSLFNRSVRRRSWRKSMSSKRVRGRKACSNAVVIQWTQSRTTRGYRSHFRRLAWQTLKRSSKMPYQKI